METPRFRILIIDDEKKIVKLIKSLIDWDNLPLELAGTAHDGVSALELIEREQPDIVILDIRMPGFSGLDIISRIKESDRQIHFIIVSGYRHFEYAHNAIKFGVEDYLLKPVKEEELNRTLRKIIDRKEKDNRREERELQNREQDFLRALIRLGYESGSGFRDLVTRYRISFEYPFFELILLKNDLNTDEINDNELVLLNDKTANAVTSCFSDGRISVFLHRGEKGFYILLNYREGDGRFVANYLFNLIESLHSYRDLFSQLKSTVVRSGSFVELKHFGASMEMVDRLVLERYVLGCGIVLEKLPGKEQAGIRDIFPNNQKTLFSRNIEVLDGEGAAGTVRDLYGVLKREKASGALRIRTLEEIFRIFIYHVETLFEFGSDLQERIDRFREVLLIQSSDEVIFSRTAVFFQSLLDELNRERQNRDDRPILDAKKYINENFFLNLSLEEVSNAVGMNPTYLSSLFKKKTGMGFVEYLTQVRIEEAKELLSDHKRSITDTAGEVGYRDAKHFTKQFRKIVGLSPADYRKIYY